jgi:TonB family protein
VDPVYPEQAKAIRLSGKVVLSVTVNEQGYVSDTQVSMGHPFLREAAIDAVRQWQYSPTLLQGQPVPVKTQVTVVFVLRGDQAEAGSGASAPSMPPPSKMNLKVMQFSGQDWYFIVRAIPIDDLPGGGEFQAPELAFTMESVFKWQNLAKTGWPTNQAKGTPLVYSFVVNEAGELKDFTRSQGPEVPNLERELAQVRVVSPGFRGSSLVRCQYLLEFRVGLSSEEIGNVIRSDAIRYRGTGTIQ